MNSNDSMHAMSNAYFNPATYYGWPEPQGATSQAGVNTIFDYSNMSFRFPEGTSSHSGAVRFHRKEPYIHSHSSHSGAMLFHQGEPCVHSHSSHSGAVLSHQGEPYIHSHSSHSGAMLSHQGEPYIHSHSSHSGAMLSHQGEPGVHSFPGLDADSPLLTDELPRRPEEDSKNHAALKQSAILSQPTLSEDAHAPELKRPGKRKKSTSKTVRMRFSDTDVALINGIVKNEKFKNRSSFIKTCINAYWTCNYGYSLVDFRHNVTPANLAQSQCAAERGESGTALTQEEQEEHVTEKKSQPIKILFYNNELTSVDEEAKKQGYGDRKSFIKYCIDRFTSNKYPRELAPLMIKGASSHFGATCFHEGEPCNYSFSGIDADYPLLIGELPPRPQ